MIVVYAYWGHYRMYVKPETFTLIMALLFVDVSTIRECKYITAFGAPLSRSLTCLRIIIETIFIHNTYTKHLSGTKADTKNDANITIHISTCICTMNLK